MSVCERDLPVPPDAPPVPASQQTITGSLDDTGGPPRTPTQSRPTATVTLLKDKDIDTRLEKAAIILATKQKPPNATALDVQTTRLDPQVKEGKKVLEKELETFTELPERSKFASSLYHHLASSERIDDFLADTDVYKKAKCRWALPKSQKSLKEECMYEPLVKLLNAIFQWFWNETNTRKAVDTHSTRLPHKEFVDTSNYSRPDITVKAQGPSFELPEKKTIGYSNIITCFEVKVTNQGSSVAEELLQLAGYARQIFIQQPNRRFVRALIITEQSFRLFHFDRSGVQYTQAINIHERTGAHTFVRLVLGLSSQEESDAGLDTSIQWEIENGRKVGGHLTTRGRNNTEVKYRLAEVDPVGLSYKIRDRGVICWKVIDTTSGDILLVKETWRAENRLSEDFYHEKAKAVPGVAQMISFEYNRGETKEFRGFDSSPPHEFHNRIAGRVVLDTHGKSIKHFKSAKELVCALRDAIEGHKELSMRNALHGRITLDNVVLGKPDAPPGYRGLLMGLDMAIVNKMDASNFSAEPMAATEMYQSITEIRRSHGLIDQLPQGYLDDLESFVYVLTRIMYGYDHTGAEYDLSMTVKLWGLERGRNEADSKSDYLRSNWVDLGCGVQERWPPSCIELLLGFKRFLNEMNYEKMRIANQSRGTKEMNKAWKALTAQLPVQYRTVLDLFDTAIRKMESGDDEIPPSPGPDESRSSSPARDPRSSSPFMVFNAHTSSPFSNPQSPDYELQTDARNFLKRIPMGPPDDQPKAKRGPGTPTLRSRTRTPRSTLLRSPELPPMRPVAGRNKSSRSHTLDREKDQSVALPK